MTQTLPGHVEDTVHNTSVQVSGSLSGRVVFRGVAEDAGGPCGTQRLGEGLVQLPVCVFEALDAFGGDLKPA